MSDLPVPSTPGGGAARNARGSVGAERDEATAEAAAGIPCIESQNALLASIEARLTEEVRGLVGALDQFSNRAKLIGEWLPESAQFGKTVTSLLVLLSLQCSHAFRKGLDKPIFLDDGAEYLRELGLTLEQAFREVRLDGRRYAAVACTDDGLDDFSKRTSGADEC